MSIPKITENPPGVGRDYNAWGQVLNAMLNKTKTVANSLVDLVTDGRLSSTVIRQQIGDRVMEEVGNVEAGGITDSFLAGKLTDPATLSGSVLLDTIDSKAVPLSTASTQLAGVPDGGVPTAMRDTGQPATTFGSVPMVVKDEAFTNVPVVIANSASYYQSSTGGAPVEGIVVTVRADANANTAITLVLPQVAWAQGSVTPAEVHYVIYPDGDVHCSKWTGSSESIYYRSMVSPWNDGRVHTLAIWIDHENNTLTMMHPRGEIVSLPVGTIDASKISQYGLFELYKQNSDGSQVTIDVLSFELFERGRRVGPLSLNTVGRALRKSAVAEGAEYVFSGDQATAGQQLYPFPTQFSSLLRKTVKQPPSGKMLVTVGANIEASGSASANLLFRVGVDVKGASGTGVGGAIRQAFNYSLTMAAAGLVVGDYVERTIPVTMPGRVGEDFDLVFSAVQSGGSEGAIKYVMNAASGYGMELSAVPLN